MTPETTAVYAAIARREEEAELKLRAELAKASRAVIAI